MAICIVLPLVLAASRAWGARRGLVERRLVRHPFRREVRPHLVQALNIWLCCLLLGGVVAAGGTHYARIWLSLDDAQFSVMLAAFAGGLLLLAALALVPRRRVSPAINLLVALCSGFLALQLATISIPDRARPSCSTHHLSGEWFVLNGGRSVLLNGHSPNESNAVDFLRLGANGRTHTGGSDAPLSAYAGFGWPVLAPADGRIVEDGTGSGGIVSRFPTFRALRAPPGDSSTEAIQRSGASHVLPGGGCTAVEDPRSGQRRRHPRPNDDGSLSARPGICPAPTRPRRAPASRRREPRHVRGPRRPKCGWRREGAQFHVGPSAYRLICPTARRGSAPVRGSRAVA